MSTLPAVTALAMVTPAVTRARLSALERSGTVVGSLSAAGTLGSLAGTFLTGFVLVALLPMTGILLVAGSVCLVLALAVARPRRRVVAATVVAAVVSAGALIAVPGRCDVDTVYYCARVEVDPQRPTGRVLVLDDLRHSYVDVTDPRHLEFAYVRRFAAAVDTAVPAGARIDAVHLGGGVFTWPRGLGASRPGRASTVLEVDRGVVDLGYRELDVGGVPGLDVRVGDARTTLRALPASSADLVVGDAFGARSAPWHLATVEFVDEVRRVLRPGGVYLLNVIDNDPRALVAAQIATLASRFPHVMALAGPEQLRRGGGGNVVLVAADRPLDIAALQARLAALGEPAAVLDEAATRALAGDARPLTDDHAPADQLITPYRYAAQVPQ
jgi:spermidine synthase